MAKIALSLPLTPIGHIILPSSMSALSNFCQVDTREVNAMATERTSNPGPDPTTCNATSRATHDEAGQQVPNKTCDLPKGHEKDGDDGPVHRDYRKGFFGS